MAAGVWFLAHWLKALPFGTACGAWTGIGAVSIAVIGIVFFMSQRLWFELLVSE